MTIKETRFAFGENWATFSEKVTEERIDAAIEGLRRLFPNGELEGQAFLDIGCGSGLSMLAALRLGASRVNGIDLDPNSVRTTANLLNRYARDDEWHVEERSVFALRSQTFPVVYSWGVLHHTGHMRKAIEQAASVVAPNGLFAIATYRKTPLCSVWRNIKWLYNHVPSFCQAGMRTGYKAAFYTTQAARGTNPFAYARDYKLNRGMDIDNDIHDWLGGYPYESADADFIRGFVTRMGLSLIRENVKPPGSGRFGTGCDEFVFRRTGAV